MNKVFLIALFGAVAVSADNSAPAAQPTPGPPVPLPPTPVVCPTDRSQCSDDHVSCNSWASAQGTVWPDAAASQCDVNPNYMLKRCTLSCCAICQTCPGENRKNGFTKRGTAQTLWPYVATSGTGTNPETANTNLNQCVKDKHALCRQWADEGECFEYRVVANFGTYASRNTQAKWMHENCNSACCPGCAQSCPTDRNDCSNFYGESSCVRWGRSGECAANPTWMNENCSKECCPTCRPEPAPVAAPVYTAPRYQQQPYQQQPYQQYNGFRNTNPYGIYNPYGR